MEGTHVITTFPDELQTLFLSFLGEVPSLVNASQVCKKWNKLIQQATGKNDAIIWKTAFEKYFGYSPTLSANSTLTFRELCHRRYMLLKNFTAYSYTEQSLLYHGPTAITTHFVFFQKNHQVHCVDRTTNKPLSYTLPQLPVLQHMELSSLTKDIIKIKTNVVLNNAFEGRVLLYDASNTQSSTLLFSTTRAYAGSKPTPLLNASWHLSHRVFYLSHDNYFSYFDIQTQQSRSLTQVKIDASLTPSDLLFIEGSDTLALFNLTIGELQVIDLITDNVYLLKTVDIGFKTCPIGNEIALISNNTLFLYQKNSLLALNLKTKQSTSTSLSLVPKIFNDRFIVAHKDAELSLWDLHNLTDIPTTITLPKSCYPLFLHENKLLVYEKTSLYIWNVETHRLEHTIPLDTSFDARVMGYFEHCVWVAIKISMAPSHLFMFIDMHSGTILRKDTHEGKIEAIPHPRLDNKNSISFDAHEYSFTSVSTGTTYSPAPEKNVKIRNFISSQEQKKVEVTTKSFRNLLSYFSTQ